MCIRDSSYYAREEELAQGFFTMRDGCRVGVCGAYILRPGGGCSMRAIGSACIRAVSYTHLDVYKRQGWKPPGGRRPKRAPVSFRADSVGADGCPVTALEYNAEWNREPRLCQGAALCIWKGADAVSYTHLLLL